MRVRNVAVLLVAAAFVLGVGLPRATHATQPARDGAQDAASGYRVVLHSLSLIGVRYRRGGSSPETGLDCSGLVQHVFQQVLGFELPRRSEEMSRTGTPVTIDRLRPGDLVFFNTLRRSFSHVGIYVGENRFVHAPSPGGRVRVESIGSRYWARRFSGARRVAPEEPAPPARLLQARGDAARALHVRGDVAETELQPDRVSALPRDSFSAY